jgi:hypothetical protein
MAVEWCGYSGATNQSYTIIETGYYTVITSDESGCSTSTTMWVEFTGVEDISIAEGLHIFPNPASSNVTIELSNVRGELHLLNAIGQIVFSERAISGITEIDVSSLADGFYEVIIIDGPQEYFSKLLKQ